MDNRYGQYNSDGTVTEPEVSILTGERIGKTGSIREVIMGTSYWYRYEGTSAHLVTDELRAEWARGVSGSVAAPSKRRDAQESAS